MPKSTSFRRRWQFSLRFLLMLILVVAAFFAGMTLERRRAERAIRTEGKLSPEQQAQQKLAPELQAWVDAYEKIQVGMSEQEVDAVLRGYPSRTENAPNVEPPGHYTKTYDEKHGAIEGDYFICVLFDDKHVAVSKQMSEYLK